MKMNYVIEGSVSELYADESDNFTFKVIGSEGFSLKQEEVRFNVLCPEELEKISKKKSENICSPCFVLSQNHQFAISDKNKVLIIQHGSVGRKFRLTIKLEDGKKLSKYFDDEKLPIKISSVKLLQN